MAYWAHVGDSRVYHFRGRELLERTRDHSHVEFLIREGVITAGSGAGPPDAQLCRKLSRRRATVA